MFGDQQDKGLLLTACTVADLVCALFRLGW